MHSSARRRWFRAAGADRRPLARRVAEAVGRPLLGMAGDDADEVALHAAPQRNMIWSRRKAFEEAA